MLVIVIIMEEKSLESASKLVLAFKWWVSTLSVIIFSSLQSRVEGHCIFNGDCFTEKKKKSQDGHMLKCKKNSAWKHKKYYHSYFLS